MPTRIADIDISQPLPVLRVDGYDRVLALVRQNRCPIGLIQLTVQEPILGADAISTAIAAQIATIPLRQAPSPAAPLSVVICTHERPDDLARCLDALCSMTGAGHEIIVVDNAPTTTRTSELVARYPVRYLCEPRIGLNHARNCGLRAARYPLVAFTDDDAAPDARWIDAIAQPFADPIVGCVTGLVLPLELETPAQEQFEVYCAHRRSFAPRVFTGKTLPPAAAGVVGMGANMAMRRDLALRLGAFDPRLDGGTMTCSGGDTDMFARVLDAGSQIVYTPDAMVWHRHRREMGQLRDCIFGYGVGLYSFLTKRLTEQHDMHALEIAARWFAGPLVKAMWRRIRGQPTVRAELLIREAIGACLGPLRFWQATTLAGRETLIDYQEMEVVTEVQHAEMEAN